MVGMFELNNLSLTVPTPVEDYFLLIDDLPEVQGTHSKHCTLPDSLSGRAAPPYLIHSRPTLLHWLGVCRRRRRLLRLRRNRCWMRWTRPTTSPVR